MADSERYRLETIDRIRRRVERASCPHELQRMDVRRQRFVCDDCGGRIPVGWSNRPTPTEQQTDGGEER